MTDSFDPRETPHEILHASCVAVADRGALIIGPSGSGKSTLALSLMAYGASLVADDRVVLERVKNTVIASAPPPIRGLIEARGIGLLTCDTVGPVPVTVVVDMEKSETTRYPDKRTIPLLGQPMALLHRVDGAHFAPALMQFLRSGRYENE